MADQVEVPKLVMHPVVGVPADSIGVSKLVMYVLLIPGSDGAVDTSNRQGHVHSQIIRRG